MCSPHPRSNWLAAIAASGLALAIGCSAGDDDDHDTPLPEDAFTLIVIPDIQYVTLGYPEILDEMTAWIVAERDKRNILFVLQEGDLTHNNTEEEWDAASAGFTNLDGQVPYVVAVGNHDMDEEGDTTHFNTAFPVSRFEGEAWFGGPMEPDRMDNSYVTFTASETQWGILSLTYSPAAEPQLWAANIADELADHRMILLTHAYLDPSGDLSFPGQSLWDNVIRERANFSLVFNGHYLDGEASRLASEGDHGNVVHQLFANYQDRPFGGAGLMRILTVDPTAATISVETYSPWMDFYEEDETNQFVLEDVELGAL